MTVSQGMRVPVPVSPRARRFRRPRLTAALAITIVRIVLLMWFVVLQLLHLNIGLADNGDFDRIMDWYTSKPYGFTTDNPPSGSDEWSRRFFNYYLPVWDLDFPFTSDVYSSALVLWFPGVIANYLFVSSSILFLPIVSLTPRILALLSIMGVFRWIDTTILDAKRRLVLYLTFGLPLVVALTTTDYVAYFNSFFQDPASLTFLVVFAVVALHHRRCPTWKTMALALIALALLSTAKASTAYLAIAGMALLWPSRLVERWRGGAALLLTVAAIGLAVGGLRVTERANNAQYTEYHGLFFGALTFSDHPEEHLARLGLGDLGPCVGLGGFTEEAAALNCVTRASATTRADTVRVILHEPIIAPRMLLYAARNMQDLRLPGFGKYALNDRPAGADSASVRATMNTWSLVKHSWFPRGTSLYVALALYVALFSASLRWRSVPQELSMLGLFACLATVMDMTVAILGDGRQEITKHLVLANLLFDLASILALSVAALALSGRRQDVDVSLRTGDAVARGESDRGPRGVES